MSDTPVSLPEHLLLSPVEARLLGCLIEKEAITPEQYPLTQNAAQVAANQKTSREPVMELEPGEVGHALRRMEERKLVRSQHGSRAQRYEHRFAESYGITRQQQALLGLLLLRGAQTAPELLARSERLGKFADLDDLRHTLDRLIQREPALAVLVPRSGAQREDRYMHLLCGAVDIESLRDHSGRSASAAPRDDLLDRIAALEARIAELERRLGDGG